MAISLVGCFYSVMLNVPVEMLYTFHNGQTRSLCRSVIGRLMGLSCGQRVALVSLLVDHCITKLI